MCDFEQGRRVTLRVGLMNSVRIGILIPFCWFTMIGGDAVSGGFSDRLVGKEKLPADKRSTQDPVMPPSKGVAEERIAPAGSVPGDASFSNQPATTSPGNRFASGSFDVVGLKLGMRQEDAVDAVHARRRELNGKPITFEIVKEGTHQVLVQGETPRTRFVALSDAKSVVDAFDLTEQESRSRSAAQDPKVQRFMANGQIEVFEFQFPNVPNYDQVTVLTRLQRLAPAVSLDTIRGALIKKYGPPTVDDKLSMVWLLDEASLPMAGKDVAKCRGATLPPGTPVGAYDYSITAIKGCGEQLTVQIQGTLEVAMMIQTTLYHHQRLIDEREATQKATLSRFGLAPEQSRKAPAPQF